MVKYKCIVEYDGTNFFGFQIQKNNPSIQANIEQALQKLTGENIKIFCAGRTDKGVHATHQVIHFDTTKVFQEDSLTKAINFHLKSKEISIISSKKLPENSNFHARFSAKERTYIYKIFIRNSHLTFNKNLYWHSRKQLNLESIKSCFQYLIGTHDFSSFRATSCQSISPIKTINSITLKKINKNEVHFKISAPSFLHHQVRNIVGTLYLVGINKITPKDFQNILEAKDRKKAGKTAPPCGLYLIGVKY
jgi:tRNA pseudouridine38-40 synthase